MSTPDAPRTPPYPPEADPAPDVDVEPAVVPGEQTDPDRRLTGGDDPERTPPA